MKSDNELWEDAIQIVLKRNGVYVMTMHKNPPHGLVKDVIREIRMSKLVNRGSPDHGTFMPTKIEYYVYDGWYSEDKVAFNESEIAEKLAKNV